MVVPPCLGEVLPWRFPILQVSQVKSYNELLIRHLREQEYLGTTRADVLTEEDRRWVWLVRGVAG